MHELSLAQGLLKQVLAIAHENNVSKVNRIKVSIGTLSGIVVDSFIFGFDALKKDNPIIEKAVLEIESQTPMLYCSSCNHQTPAPNSWPSQAMNCPKCHASGLMPVGGDELLLMQIEME